MRHSAEKPAQVAEQLFQTAIALHQDGALQRAEHLYREVLRQFPQHAGALNMLGVIGCQTGNFKQGADLIRQAIELDPDLIDAPARAPFVELGLVSNFSFLRGASDAVDLVLYAFEHGSNGDLFVQKAPAATIETLARALTDLVGKPDHPINVIGTRHGEKLYETLVGLEDMYRAEDLGEYFRILPDNRDLNYDKYFSQYFA